MDTYTRSTVVVDGISTSYLTAGEGQPVLLLHGGEFGGGAEICWESSIGPLAEHYRVIAPDLLGFGRTDKIVDFLDGRGRRIAHLARFCATLGLHDFAVIGNSMGGMLALADAGSRRSRLPARALVSIAGGGKLESSPHTDALFDYDGSLDGMRAIVAALFHGDRWPADDDYVARRHRLSIEPGAWEAIAAARFRRPAAEGRPAPGIGYREIGVPTLVVAGAEDKLKPTGWTDELTTQIPVSRAARIADAGHCPQIEQPEPTVAVLLEFLSGQFGRQSLREYAS
ncbi:alpha/beta fold hydrolase [Amycolatopsis jejuensis]|uniref:alpha/beta fold hydrolase n=1 Tax=Amycolatopsis jejuensis TaxID=330084 RepID=UPI0005277072|nr:alpha/beta hydrolase [Amycolatopsis jejuensis]